jgi:hypothetical protein
MNGTNTGKACGPWNHTGRCFRCQLQGSCGRMPSEEHRSNAPPRPPLPLYDVQNVPVDGLDYGKLHHFRPRTRSG